MFKREGSFTVVYGGPSGCGRDTPVETWGPDQLSPLKSDNVATFTQLRKIFVTARKNFTMATEKISSLRCEGTGARDRDVTDARERRRRMYYLH